MIKEICQYIENNTSFTLNTDIYCMVRPEDAPDRSVVVSLSSPSQQDFYLPDIEDVIVQVSCRDFDIHNAFDDSNTINQLLNGSAGRTLPVVESGVTITANIIHCISGPYNRGADDKGRYIVVSNYIFKTQNAN